MKLRWSTKALPDGDVELTVRDEESGYVAHGFMHSVRNSTVRAALMHQLRLDMRELLVMRLKGEPVVGAVMRKRPKGRPRCVREIDSVSRTLKLEGVKRSYRWSEVEYAS